MDYREIKNYWDEFEYNKLKLLYHKDKADAILSLLSGGTEGCDYLLPISVELHLTDHCNLNCPWCTDRELHKNKATLSKEVLKGLIKTFAGNHTGITLEGGGEPTLHPDFKELVSFGAKQHAELGLITNGTRNISECVKDFKWVRVSLDASNAAEYETEKGSRGGGRAI